MIATSASSDAAASARPPLRNASAASAHCLRWRFSTAISCCSSRSPRACFASFWRPSISRRSAATRGRSWAFVAAARSAWICSVMLTAVKGSRGSPPQSLRIIM